MSGKRAKRERKISKGNSAVVIAGPVVNILELARKTQNEKVDAAFIEMALADLMSDIQYIEEKYCVTLAGDRADFDRARRDWKLLTRMQVAYAVSIWRSGIFERYMS